MDSCTVYSFMFVPTFRMVSTWMWLSPWKSRQHFLPKRWEQTDHTTQCKNPQDPHMLWSSSLLRCFISECLWPTCIIIVLLYFVHYTVTAVHNWVLNPASFKTGTSSGWGVSIGKPVFHHWTCYKTWTFDNVHSIAANKKVLWHFCPY
jgi:hypothetical protein